MKTNSDKYHKALIYSTSDILHFALIYYQTAFFLSLHFRIIGFYCLIFYHAQNGIMLRIKDELVTVSKKSLRFRGSITVLLVSSSESRMNLEFRGSCTSEG